MGDTSIEWTDYTFNPWIGCQKVSSGCANCYAEKDTYSRVSKSRGLPLWGPKAERHRTSEANWRKPLAWNRAAKEDREAYEYHCADVTHGPYVRPKVFCASLADVFEDHPSLAEWRSDLWRLIETCTELDWLLLTKRPENVLGMVPKPWIEGRIWGYPVPFHFPAKWPGHVFVGTSVEDQKAADECIPHLLKVPAPVRFLSMEPLLGPVNLDPPTCPTCGGHDAGTAGDGTPCCREHGDEMAFGAWLDPCADAKQRGINWVIVGGESGHGARPMHPDWVRSIRDQCVDAGVPFFFKQWGEWLPMDHQPRSKAFPSVVADDYPGFPKGGYPESRVHRWAGLGDSYRIGKRFAGRMLDGRTWDEMPEVRR